MKKKIYLIEFSLQITFEFHPTKNQPLKVDQLTIGSGKRVWWKCPKGEDHEWQAVVNKRTLRKQNCPFCSGRYADSKTNLAVNYPELMDEWDWEKNNFLGLDPYKLLPKSGKEAYWICKKNKHSYKTEIFNRTRGHGCKKCLQSESIAITHPKLCEEWYQPGNGDLTPWDVSKGSNIKVSWRCKEKGHIFLAAVYSIAQGGKCPYCTNKKVCKDNCLATVRPDIARDWHPFLNGEFTPENTLPSTKLRVFWYCDEYHIYEATVNKRFNKSGCPYCSNHRVSRKNSLGILFPKLVKEWDKKKNNDTPFDVSVSSDKLRHWICEKCGHSWRTSPSSRTRQPNPSGCPACSGRVATPENNLGINFPEVAKEWHPTLNGDLSATEFLSYSNYKAMWVCDRGHVWPSTIANRVLGNDCPKCHSKSSKKELRIFSELKSIFNCESQKMVDGLECDIYVNELSLVMEYDGSYYHQNRRKEDKAKNKSLENLGLGVLRLRETPLRKISRNDILIYDKQITPKVIIDILFYIKLNYEIKERQIKLIEKYSNDAVFKNESDFKKLIRDRKRPPVGRSLGERFPELIKEWDYNSNSPFTPFDIYARSGKKFGWVCKDGHIWLATPDHRTRGTGCPKC